jgi:hypothetical protein
MAYTYVSALARQGRTDPTWKPVDVGNVPITTIFASYYEISIQLSSPFIDGPVYLTKDLLWQQRPAQIPSSLTINQWLVSIGNQTLTTLSEAPATTPTPVRYSDAWQAGFDIALADIARNPQTQAAAASLPDLRLTKEGLDMVSMSNYLLVTVNGYLHRSVGTVNGLYALGGGLTHQISNENYCGIFSFLNVGKVQQIPITPAMVHKPSLQLMYSQSAYISVPVSLEGKIVLLSLGGYLHCLDGMYTKVSNTTIKINTHRLQLPQRLYESSKRIDLSSLPIATSRQTSEQWGTASVYSDAVILNYLTLPQSFLIVVDAPSWYTQTHALERSAIPGRYFGYVKRRLPLIGPLGRLYEYRLSREEDTYVYGCESMQDPQFNFETTLFRNLRSIGPQQYSAMPWRPGLGHLLEMGTFR